MSYERLILIECQNTVKINPLKVLALLRCFKQLRRAGLPSVLRDASYDAPQDERKDAFTPERSRRVAKPEGLDKRRMVEREGFEPSRPISGALA